MRQLVSYISIIITLALISVIISSCLEEDDDDWRYIEDYRWRLIDGCLIVGYDQQQLLKLTELGYETFTPIVDMLFGFFEFSKDNPEYTPLQLARSGQTIGIKKNVKRVGSITFQLTERGNLRVKTELEQSVPANSIKFSFEALENASFWGFDEQYNFMDLKGQSFPALVQEQGVGRGGDPVNHRQDRLTNTYFPMPYFMDPINGYGFLVHSSSACFFDFAFLNTFNWTVEVWDKRQVDIILIPGDDPKSIVKGLRAEVGPLESKPLPYF